MTQRAPLYSGVVARARSVELLTWTHGLPPGRIGDPVPTPIRDRDIRNPAPKPQNLELRFWANGLPPGVVALTIPPRQVDWPNPRVASPSIELRTWTHSQFAVPVALPFSQTDWPNPRGVTPSVELKTWIETLPPGEIARTIPKAQWDWPNPQVRVQNLELRTWIQTPNNAPVPYPLNQYDWPNPLIERGLYFDQPPNLAIFAVLVPNVVGETQAQATTDITNVGLAVTATTAYSDTVAAGLVISQSPVAGSQAILGDTVLIVISLGGAPASAEVPAGRRRRKRTLYLVKVDGEEFEFASYEAAVAFLRKAQEAANELAARAIEDAVARQSKTPVEVPLPTLKMPQITASTRELRSEITATKRAVATIYDRAIRDAEIAIVFELVRRKQEEDEEIFWLF